MFDTDKFDKEGGFEQEVTQREVMTDQSNLTKKKALRLGMVIAILIGIIMALVFGVDLYKFYKGVNLYKSQKYDAALTQFEEVNYFSTSKYQAWA